MMMLTHGAFLVFEVTPTMLWAINIATGFGYGGAFAMANGLVAIYYGTKYVGINSGLTALAPAIGGTSFTYISAEFLQRVMQSSGHDKCDLGKACFMNSLIMSTAGLTVAVILASLLTIRHYRSRMKLYVRV